MLQIEEVAEQKWEFAPILLDRTHVDNAPVNNLLINHLAPFSINIGLADKTRSIKPAVKFDPRA